MSLRKKDVKFVSLRKKDTKFVSLRKKDTEFVSLYGKKDTKFASLRRQKFVESTNYSMVSLLRQKFAQSTNYSMVSLRGSISNCTISGNKSFILISAALNIHSTWLRRVELIYLEYNRSAIQVVSDFM